MISDELIKKLKSRAKKENISTCHEPLSGRLVKQCEAKLGFSLPELVKLVYTKVSNGHIGPYGRMMPLIDGMYIEDGAFAEDYGDDDEVEDVITVYTNFLKPHRRFVPEEDVDIDYPWEWAPHLVPICRWGDQFYSVLDCTVDNGLVYLCDISNPRINYKQAYENKTDSFALPGVCFADWLASWFDATQIQYIPNPYRDNPELYLPKEDYLPGETGDEYRLRKKAEAGDVHAQIELGTVHNRWSSRRSKAVYWLERACESDNANAASCAKKLLALGYRDGKFEAADWSKAHQCSAQLEEPIPFYFDEKPKSFYALTNIKDCFHEAVSWWEKEAREGNGQAAYSLALALPEAANSWFEEAARLGYLPAIEKIKKGV